MNMKRWITGSIMFCSMIVLLTAAGDPASAMGIRHKHHEPARNHGTSTSGNSDSQPGSESSRVPEPSTLALIGAGLVGAGVYAAVKRRNRK